VQLEPLVINLANLLSERLFRVPECKRAYAWGKKQRLELFNDIKRIKLSDEDHFMATIVGLSREKRQIVADRFTVADIVDCQQRLVTFIILMKAVQKSLDVGDKVEKKLADELIELLVRGGDLSLLLIQTNHDTSHIFVDYVRDGSIPKIAVSTSADQNIIDAIDECEAFLKTWISGGTLIELVGIIRNRLWAIFHSVDDEGLVNRVFEVLNSRGLDVESIDKLKNRLMGLVFEHGAIGGREDAIKEFELRVILLHVYHKRLEQKRSFRLRRLMNLPISE
jgi:uncharacterized protein with ParB-like and HNH nuclease domain